MQSVSRDRETVIERKKERASTAERERERTDFNCQQVGEIEIVPKYNEKFSIYLGLKVVNNF